MGRRALVIFPFLLQACFVGFDAPHPHTHAGPPYGRVAAAYEPKGTYVPQAARQNFEARTVSWAPGGTEEGFTYRGGTIRVENINRQDADSNLIARIRVQNQTASPIAAEYRIDFFNDDGKRLISDRDLWRGFILASFGSVELDNVCRVRGARFFKLHIRDRRA